MRKSTLFATIAFVLFCVSLALPSVDFVIINKPAPIPGYMIVWIAFGSGVEALVSMFGGEAARMENDMILATFAAGFNLLVLAMPLLLYRDGLARRGLTIGAALIVIGVASGLATPFAFGKSVVGFEAGFFVWLLAYLVLLAALCIAWREAGNRP